MVQIQALQRLQKSLNQKKAKLDVTRIFERKDVQDYIIQLNRYDQLWREGVSPKGDVVGVYSQVTEAIVDSRTINASVFRFNGESKRKTTGEKYFFFDKGDYFNQFDVYVDEYGFVIISNSATAEELKLKYGQLLGLTDENKAKLSVFVKKIILQELNS